MEIGKIQTLEVVREKDFGVFLAEPGKKRDGREDSVLLPKNRFRRERRSGTAWKCSFIRIRRTG